MILLQGKRLRSDHARLDQRNSVTKVVSKRYASEMRAFAHS